jgi:hypothetical protein
MARVVCTLIAMGWIRGVLYSRVALDPVTFWRIRVKVDICMLESYICHVVRDHLTYIVVTSGSMVED